MAVPTEVSAEASQSTLPQEQVSEQVSVDTGAPVAGETIEPSTDAVVDSAQGATELSIDHADVEPTDAVEPTHDTLEIGDMNSNNAETPTTVAVEDNSQNDEAPEVGLATEGSDISPEPTKVSVMGDSEDEVEDNKVEAGTTFNPETFPGGKMPEPDTIEPESKEEVEDDEPELPSSPVAEEETKDETTHEEDEIAPEDMDSTDKRLMVAIDRWKSKKAQEVKDLTELREKVESDIAKMNDEISDLQGRVSTKESELDSIGQLLDEIGEVEEESQAA